MTGQTFIEANAREWLKLEQLPLGTQLLPLAEPVPKGSIHRLRMDAGTVIPVHSHPCNEYVYVIEGVVETGGRECKKGTFWQTPANTRQGPHKAITNSEIITVRLGPMGAFE